MQASETIPELDPFRTEPKQMPAGAVGKVGYLKLDFEKRGEKTALVGLHRVAPLLVQQALYWDTALPDMACVFIASTSGGVLQGDRLSCQFNLAENTRVHLTTQGATRLQQMDANYATQEQIFNLSSGAYLEYIPEITIPYRDSRFVTDTRIIIPEDAVALYSEILMPGRKHHASAEMFGYDLYCASVSAERPDGKRLFSERLVVQPKLHDPRVVGVMKGFDVFGNAVLLAPQVMYEKILSQMPAPEINTEEKWAFGINKLPGNAGLICRVLGEESHTVRKKIREFWALVRLEATGKELPEEFRWR